MIVLSANRCTDVPEAVEDGSALLVHAPGRLLDPSDLGKGFLPKPCRPARHDDITVLGCRALSELGGDVATSGALDFPHKARADFTYAGSSSGISEEVYSDSAKKLSAGINRIFGAMAGCST
ncbi:hypothetical protein [Streptomyces sp. S5]|uniref:hypothetical protein n=1 Tax=Streptomyces sp. S5 TaxID=1456735 RepID=UPI00196A16EE|nr:hypothetical protein [Streptomyces sp. S5]